MSKEVVEKYTISIEVRDSNGDVIVDENDNRHHSIKYDVEMLKSNMESNLEHLAKTLKAFMPNRKITIVAYVFNTISRTYMNMFSYYVDENRFVKH
jgi:hypothetical protein